MRAYKITARTAPNCAPVPCETVRGGFAFGAFDAARAYTARHLPSFTAIPCGARLSRSVWRFEAVNHETQRGAVLYVSEV